MRAAAHLDEQGGTHGCAVANAGADDRSHIRAQSHQDSGKATHSADRAMDPRQRSTRTAEIGYLSLAVLISMIAALPLLVGPGMVATRAGGDSPFLIQRVQQIAHALIDGVFPVRWLPDANLGLGYPALSYYAALPYYLAAALHLSGLGIIAAIQATQVMGFALGALASYRLGRELKLGPAGALTASALFTFAPFHLVNVYVRGDSLSEFWAMALVALCLCLTLRLQPTSGPSTVILLAVSYAALVLTHNITALLASPVLALMLLVVAWQHPQRWQLLGTGVGSLVLGLWLSAWFWYPALAERELVQLGQQTTGYFDFRGHFRGLDLVQLNWQHDYSITVESDPFRLGLVQALLTGAGMTLLAAQSRALKSRALWLVTASAALGCALLITPLSLALWTAIPLLHYVQFPWRLLGLHAVVAAPLVGLLPERLPRVWQRWVLAAALVVLLGWGGLGALCPDYVPLNAADITAERILLFEGFSGNVGGTVRAEYLPEGMTPRYYASPQLLDRDWAAPPWTLSGSSISCTVLDRHATSQAWWVRTAAPEQVVFPTTYYPGWRATIDGQPLAVSALEGLGLVSVAFPGGSHVVALQLGPTPVRRAAELASGLGWVVALSLLGRWFVGDRRRAWGLGVGTVCTAFWLGWMAVQPISPPTSEPLQGPLVMDLASYPYLHHEPAGLRLGSALLSDYAYASDTVLPGGKVIVDLSWQDISPQQTLQVRLMSLSAHLLGQSIAWAEANVPIDARQQRLILDIPNTIPPGVYVLRLGVKLDGESLPIKTLRGSPQSRVSLAPLWVPRTTMRTQAGEAIALYGLPHQPVEIALISATTTSVNDKQLEVRLLWRALRPPQRNYAVSLRRLSAGNSAVDANAVDLAPMSADYPTGLWRPGEVVEVRLRAPSGREELSQEDAWRIVLYDRLTLAEIGWADVPLVLED